MSEQENTLIRSCFGMIHTGERTEQTRLVEELQGVIARYHLPPLKSEQVERLAAAVREWRLKMPDFLRPQLVLPEPPRCFAREYLGIFIGDEEASKT